LPTPDFGNSAVILLVWCWLGLTVLKRVTGFKE
jgi:hypothetical protein